MGQGVVFPACYLHAMLTNFIKHTTHFGAVSAVVLVQLEFTVLALAASLSLAQIKGAL